MARNAPVVMDAPAKVALFTYDNNSFVENYRDTPVNVQLGVTGATQLRSIGGTGLVPSSGEMIGATVDRRPAFVITSRRTRSDHGCAARQHRRSADRVGAD